MTSTNPIFIPIDLKLDTDEINICRNLFRALVSYVKITRLLSEGILREREAEMYSSRLCRDRYSAIV